MSGIAAAIGVGLGVAKAELVDAPEEAKQRTLQAQLEKYSPWTGQKGDPSQIKIADPFGSALQGGSQLMSASQNSKTASALQAFLNGNSKGAAQGLNDPNDPATVATNTGKFNQMLQPQVTPPGPWTGQDPVGGGSPMYSGVSSLYPPGSFDPLQAANAWSIPSTS